MSVAVPSSISNYGIEIWTPANDSVACDTSIFYITYVRHSNLKIAVTTAQQINSISQNICKHGGQ
jgi:hypothetical protein